MSTSVETEPTEKPPLKKLSDMPPRDRRKLALIFALIGLFMTVVLLQPAPVQEAVMSAVVLVAVLAGVVRNGALAVLYFRDRRWLLSFLRGLLALFLVLLSMAAIVYLVEAVQAL